MISQSRQNLSERDQNTTEQNRLQCEDVQSRHAQTNSSTKAQQKQRACQRGNREEKRQEETDTKKSKDRRTCMGCFGDPALDLPITRQSVCPEPCMLKPSISTAPFVLLRQCAKPVEMCWRCSWQRVQRWSWQTPRHE